MADENTSQGAPAPAATQQTTPPQTQTTQQTAGDQNPDWLPSRLEQAQRVERERVLKELGATDLNAVKALVEKANAAAEADKSAGQKLGEATKSLETEKSRADRLETVIKERAAHEIAQLKPEQQAAVRKLAPDTDPAAQLQAITALTPTWVTAPAASQQTPPAQAQQTPPASTAPARDAPADAGNTSPPDHAAIYAELQKSNPILAARYATQHATSIFKS